eukprot:symbB.v1.2.030193.t2/scaffold3378.1/size58068/5
MLPGSSPRMPWESEPGIAKGSPATLPMAQAEPAKQKMPWETEPGIAKGSAPMATKAEPAKQKMPWETEPGIAKGSAPMATKAEPAKQMMPWETKPAIAESSPETKPEVAKQGMPFQMDPGIAKSTPSRAESAKQIAFKSQGVPKGAPKMPSVAKGPKAKGAQASVEGVPRQSTLSDLTIWIGTVRTLISTGDFFLLKALGSGKSKSTWCNDLGSKCWSRSVGTRKSKSSRQSKGKGTSKGVDVETVEAPKDNQYGACVYCHTNFTDDSIYCRHCGVRRLETSLDWDEVSPVTPAQQAGEAGSTGQDLHTATPPAIDSMPPALPVAPAPPFQTGALPKSMPPMPPPPKPSQLSQAPEVGELEAASEEVPVPWKVQPTAKKIAPKLPKKPQPPPAVPKGAKGSGEGSGKGGGKGGEGIQDGKDGKGGVKGGKGGEMPMEKLHGKGVAQVVTFQCPVLDSEGSDVGLTISSATSVKSLKEMVSKEMEIQERDFRIVLSTGSTRRVLQDNKEMLDASLLESADLIVEQPVDITVVDIKGKHLVLKVDRSWSCEKLKSAVAKQTGDKEEDILLKLGRTALPSTEEQLGQLLPAGMQQELILARPVKVSVSDDTGQRWEIAADRSWKLRKVQQKLMEESGFSLEEQTLQHAKLSADGTLPILESEMDLENVVDGAEVHLHLLVDYGKFMERGVKEAMEAQRQRQEPQPGLPGLLGIPGVPEVVAPSAPGIFGMLGEAFGVSHEDSASQGQSMPWEDAESMRDEMWKYPPHSLDYTNLLSRKPPKVEFSALLSDPPWREHTQRDADLPLESGKRQWPKDTRASGRVSASSSAKSAKEIPSGKVVEDDDGYGSESASNASEGSEVSSVAFSKELPRLEALKGFEAEDLSKGHHGGPPQNPQQMTSESSNESDSLSFEKMENHQAVSLVDERDERDLVDPVDSETSQEVAEGMAPNSPSGQGETGYMTSSLVQWGGFQRLRHSVAPGPGTIIFVNPNDHPGIGTPGGSRSAAKRVMRRQRIQDARAGQVDVWQQVASSNRLQEDVRKEVLHELRQQREEASQRIASIGETSPEAVDDDGPAVKFSFYVNDLQQPSQETKKDHERKPFWSPQNKGLSQKPVLLPGSAPWGGFAIQMAGHFDDSSRGSESAKRSMRQERDRRETPDRGAGNGD